jgi:hypothetical protein
MKLAIQVITMFAAVLFIGLKVDNNFLSEAAPEPARPVPSGGDSSLEVKPPSDGGPVPLDFKLQGSSPNGQKAAGDLQTPQTGDDLQPNARTNLFKDDS